MPPFLFERLTCPEDMFIIRRRAWNATPLVFFPSPTPVSVCPWIDFPVESGPDSPDPPSFFTQAVSQ